MPSKLYDSFKAATIAYLAALRPHRWRLHATSIFFLACLFWGGFHSPLLAQTTLVKNINPSDNSSPAGFTVLGTNFYFRANDGTNGIELWKTDGTADGTVMVKDINPSGNSSPAGFTVLGTNLYFQANDGINGIELWKTDGTADGTVLVKDINPSGNSSPAGFTVLGTNLYFQATDGINGIELWKTDGTADGTVLVKDINTGSGSSSPTGFTVLGTNLYFQANDGTNGTELWKTDGTADGTVLVKNINTGSGNSSPAGFRVMGTNLYFSANDATNGIELWKTDGTADGTVLVKDINTGSNPSSPAGFRVMGTNLYFQATDATNGSELWKTDGTADGTVLVKDINTGSGGSNPAGITVMGTNLYFRGIDGTNGAELWKTDGTADGTVLVKDINTGSGNSSPIGFTLLGTNLYFQATDATNGSELWKSDGTADGTVLVKDINPGVNSSAPTGFTVLGTNLYFQATDATNGSELWKYSPATPTITTTFTLTPFSACAGTASTSTLSQYFRVSGSNLTADITVTAPTDFEVSTEGGDFGPSVTLTQSGGIVEITTIFVRMASTATGTPSGNVTCASTGATTQNVAASGTVNTRPTITPGTISSVLTTATSFSIPYTATGSPDLFTLFATTPAISGFTTLINQSLTDSPISVAIPASAANTYHFNLTVRNSSTGCVSNAVAVALTVTPPVVLSCPVNTTTAACQTQAAVNAAFAAWLATATGTGGCIAVPAVNTIEGLAVNSLTSSVTGLTNNNTGAPSACGGSTTVTFTYTSSCAPTTTTCQATFTVAPPQVVLTCPANTTAAACQTQAAVNTAFATWLATASASGGCNGVLTNNNTGAPLATGGSKTVTFTYTSTCAPLTTTCQASFTVLADTQPPTIACPANISVNSTAGLCGAIVNFTTPVGTDNCSGATTMQTAGLPSGSTFPVGTTTNSYLVTAGNGQTATCSFTVTVNDVQPPTITCPPNISVNSTAGLCGAIVNFTTPVGTDNCSGATTLQTSGLPSGATFPIGTTTNTYLVTAANSQTATCSFTVTVTDNEPPKISCPANISVNNTAGLCGAIVNFTTPVGTDNCSGATTMQTAGLPSGSTFPVGTTTNSYLVTAGNGQTATCSFTVTINDVQPPTITCPPNISVCEGTTITYTPPIGSDNCLGAVTTQISGLSSGSVFPVGITTNEFKVTATNGQSSTCSFTVMVKPLPTASISSNNSPICAGNNATFTLTGTSGATVTYNLNGDSNATVVLTGGTANVTVNAATANQTLNLVSISNGTCGQSLTGNSTVTVNALPTATISGATQVCQNAPFPTVTFMGSNGTAPYTFTYKINGGADLTITTTSGNSVTVAQTTATVGDFTYTLVSVKDASSTQCSQSQNGTVKITVNALPVVSTPQTALCTGLTMTLSPTSGGTWQSSNPSIASIDAEGIVTAFMAGVVSFTFTQTSTGCSAATASVTIKPTPTSALSASKVDVCANERVTLTPNCSIPTSTVNWNPGGPTVTPAAATLPYVYRARCVADGCVGNETEVEVRTHRILVDMKDLDVGALPKAIVRAVKDNMAPTNQINAPVFPRRWTFIANGCDASESAVFKLSGPVNFNTIDNASTYAMFANVGDTYFSIDHPNYGNGGSFPDGTYTLTVDLRSKDGIGGPFPKNRVATGSLLATRTLQFTVNNSQSMAGRQSAVGEELTVEGGRRTAAGFAEVFPNPVSHSLRLKVVESKDQKVNVSLMDASGRTMFQRSFVPQTNQHQEEFEVSQLSSGMYFLRVNTENKNATLKVVKVD